jgi:hypothetical protein
MNLRWSLVILAFAVSTDVVVCVPIPAPGDGKKNIKESSSTYRANAANNPDQIGRTPGGTWQTNQGAGARGPHAGEHADHMLEAQTVNTALRNQGVEFRNLPGHHQGALRQMLNDQRNMQFVEGGVNIRKGGMTSAGLRGQAPSGPHHDRDGYTRQTVAPAVHTANRMDQYLTGAGLRGNVHETHMAAMRSAGVVGQHSPTPLGPNRHQNAVAGPSGTHSRGSSGSSSSSGPHTPTPMNRHTTLPFHPHPGPVTPPNAHTHNHPSVHDVRREQTSHHPPSNHPTSPTPNHPHHPSSAAGPSHAGSSHQQHPVTPARQTGSNTQHPPGAPRPLRRHNSY